MIKSFKRKWTGFSEKEREPYYAYGFIFLMAALCMVQPVMDAPAGTDSYWNYTWHRLFSDQFWQSDFYPKWLMDANAGLGSPSFYFYAPLGFWISALVDNPLWEPGYYALYIVCFLATAISGIGTYHWMLLRLNPKTAMACALFYMVNPYNLLVNLYARFAYSEYLALCLLPVCFLVVELCLKNRNPLFFLIFSVITAVYFLIHLPSAVTSSWLPALYGLFLCLIRRDYRSFLMLSLSSMLAVLLAAFYWVPALELTGLIDIEALYSGKLYIANNFFDSDCSIYTSYMPRNPFYFDILAIYISLAAVSLFNPAASNKVIQPVFIFWGSLCLLVVFMQYSISLPFWQLLAIDRIQFPHRFFGIVMIAGVFFLSLYGGIFSRWNWYKIFASIYVYAVLLTAILAVENLYFTPAFIKTGEEKNYPAMVFPTGSDGRKLATELNYLPKPDYDPPSVPFEHRDLGYLKNKMVPVPKAFLLKGEGEISIPLWKPELKKIVVSLDNDAVIAVKQYYFGLWEAIRSDNGKSLPITPVTYDGLLGIKAPRGHYDILITIPPSSQEKTALTISGIGLIIFIFISGSVFFRKPS